MHNVKLARAVADWKLGRAELSARNAGLRNTVGGIAEVRKELAKLKARPDERESVALIGFVGLAKMMLAAESCVARKYVEEVPSECRSCPDSSFVFLIRDGEARFGTDDSGILLLKRKIIMHALPLVASLPLIFTAGGLMLAHTLWGKVLAGLFGLVLSGTFIDRMRGWGVFNACNAADFEKKLNRACDSVEKSLRYAEEKFGNGKRVEVLLESG
jgi:hypothetical protein